MQAEAILTHFTVSSGEGVSAFSEGTEHVYLFLGVWHGLRQAHLGDGQHLPVKSAHAVSLYMRLLQAPYTLICSHRTHCSSGH